MINRTLKNDFAQFFVLMHNNMYYITYLFASFQTPLTIYCIYQGPGGMSIIYFVEGHSQVKMIDDQTYFKRSNFPEWHLFHPSLPVRQACNF